jgi:hypothetical protein
MAAASWNLGLPHPPGYPLFDLLGHLFSFLPLGTVAFRFGLMSSLAALFSLVFVFKACSGVLERFNSDQNGSGFMTEALFVVTAFSFLSCRNVFAQCLSAKGVVYTLTLLLISVLVWMRVSGLKRLGFVYTAWFLWGLGLANHWQTVILLAPFMVLLTVRGLRFTVKSAAFICLFVVLGVSLYLYLPFRAVLTAQPSWGFPLHWSGFKWVVLRQLVSGEEMRLHPIDFYGNAVAAVLRSYSAWTPGILILAAVGLPVVYRLEKDLTRDFLVLLLPVVLALVVIHEPNNLYLIPIYLMPLAGVMVPLGFAGLFWLLVKGGWVFQKTVSCVLVLFTFFWVWSVFETQNRNRFTLAEDFGFNAMKELPRNSALLMDGDNYLMPLWYAKYVNHQRPDLIVEPTVFLYHDWGWNQLVLQSPDLKETVLSSPIFDNRLTQLAENRQHPFFYSYGRQFWPSVLDQMGKGGWYPRGLAYEWRTLTSADKARPEKLQVLSRAERFRGLEENRDVAEEDPPTNDIYSCYAQERLVLADLFHAHHDDLNTLAQLELALFFQPQTAVIYANMASLVGSRGYLAMSRCLCQMAIKIDPRVGLSHADLARLDREAQDNGGEKVKDKNPGEYAKWSEILERAGCPFLSRLALQWSGGG